MASSKRGKGPAKQPAPPPTFVAVRMLVGARAGQVVRVTGEEAAKLCGGWEPRAELVAVNVPALRETR